MRRVFLAAGAVLLSLRILACAATLEERRHAAEDLYLAEQLRCVDEAETAGASQDCRRRVKERWADGGAK